MNKFNFFRSYMEALEDLSPDEFKEAVMAICHYAFDGEQDEVTGGAKVAFKLIAPIIDRGEEISAIRSEVGAKGAAARWKNKANDSKSMANDSKPIANEWQTDSKAITLPMANDSGIGIGEGIGIGKGYIKEGTRAKYDGFFSDEELNETFNRYIEVCRNGKKCDFQMIQKKLYELAKGDVKTMIKILEQSIAQGWTGLFPISEPKTKNDKIHDFTERNYDYAALEAELRGEK